MIRVTVQLISSRTHKVSTLATVDICNDGSGDEYIGNYNYTVGWRKGEITGFPRKRLGALHLLQRVLLHAFGEPRG